MPKLTLPLVMALVAGCGPKAEPASSGDAAAATSSSSKLGDQVPSDGTSQDFAKKLVALDITNHKAVDGDGVKLVYAQLSFEGDGSWNANGAVEVMDEEMECTESGTWSMSPASSSTVASVEWTLGKTNCAGRDTGTVVRAEATLSKSGWDLKFR